MQDQVFRGGLSWQPEAVAELVNYSAHGEFGQHIVPVQQLLGHSTVIVTVRYTHTNLDSNKAAVAKLKGFGDNLVTVRTKMQQSRSKVSSI